MRILGNLSTVRMVHTTLLIFHVHCQSFMSSHPLLPLPSPTAPPTPYCPSHPPLPFPSPIAPPNPYCPSHPLLPLPSSTAPPIPYCPSHPLLPLPSSTAPPIPYCPSHPLLPLPFPTAPPIPHCPFLSVCMFASVSMSTMHVHCVYVCVFTDSLLPFLLTQFSLHQDGLTSLPLTH